MEQDGTSRKRNIIDHEKRNVELEKLKIILAKLPERELKWIIRKIYGMNKGLFKNTLSLQDRRLLEKSIFRYFYNHVLNAILFTWNALYKACMEFCIPSENFKWFESNIALQLFILNRLRSFGITIRNLETNELKSTIIEIIETHHFENNTDFLEIKESPVLKPYYLDATNYKTNWLKFLESLKLEWNIRQKKYNKFRWIRRDNIELLNWIYTYKRKGEPDSRFLLNFYHPLDNDYDGKYAHIILSLNLIDDSPINKMYLEGKNVGQLYQSSEQKYAVKLLQNAWERYKRDKRKKANKQPINFSERTMKQLNEIVAKEDTTLKKAIVKAIDKYYKDMKDNPPKLRMRNSQKRKLKAYMSMISLRYYIYNYYRQSNNLSNSQYVPLHVPNKINLKY